MWTAAKWNQVVFSDESRFNLSSDVNCVRVWRPCGERLNPAFALQRHTAPTAAQRYVHDIMQPHVLPLMQWLPGAIFQLDNARPHTARLSPHCYYPSLACPIPRFVSNRAYPGSFGTASWASHEFERTRGPVFESRRRHGRKSSHEVGGREREVRGL
ncbi:transposable element Tcb1 transposase [Trichonephila clavipes]|nr:transposable element Tcb1 transposase [Trichonephila clavipes]